MPRWTHRRHRVYCLVASVLLAISHAAAVDGAARFHQFTMEDGLSNNETYIALQDRRGYMWLGTADGLNRFDGYTFKVFRHDPNDPSSISGNFAKALYEDKSGRLWLGTFPDGLDLYDPKTASFKRYRHIPGDPSSLISDGIWCLNGLPDGRLLIGTRDSGLDVFDPATGKFQHHLAGSGPDALSNDRIQNIFVDSQQRVWLATISGLDEFDPSGKVPTRHFKVPGGKDSNVIISIAEDTQHRLWLATKGGPYLYVPGAAAITDIPGIAKAADPMAGIYLYGVLIDTQQNIWFSAEQNGLYLIRHGSDQVLHYQHQPGNNESLSANTIYGLFQDRAGYIWAETQGGVDILDPDALDVYSLKPSDIAGNQSATNDTTESIYQYRGDLLFGAAGAVYRYPLASTEGRLKDDSNVFLHLDPSRYGIASAIAGDGAQGLYVGVGFGQLLRIDEHGRITATWVPGSDLGLRPRQIHRIFLDAPHKLYLATFSNGLLEFDT